MGRRSAGATPSPRHTLPCSPGRGDGTASCMRRPLPLDNPTPPRAGSCGMGLLGRAPPPFWAALWGRGHARSPGSGRAALAGGGACARLGGTEAWLRPGNRAPAPQLGLATPPPASCAVPGLAGYAPCGARTAALGLPRFRLHVVRAALALRRRVGSRLAPTSPGRSAGSGQAAALHDPDAAENPPVPGCRLQRSPKRLRFAAARDEEATSAIATAVSAATASAAAAPATTIAVVLSAATATTVDVGRRFGFRPWWRPMSPSHSRRPGGDLDAGRGSRLDVGLDFKSRFGCHIFCIV
ncbi:rh96 [macacine betaherpesvirus 3]|uniref:Rh96 n=1 Tax=Rhesus cytomegalovirus (strain 68-1) TaxID=47929 RepID=Q2FAM0_RHCM6|nr:rh96 [macacine betaherpesvirus 3]